MPHKCIRALVSGRVQGVFFRESTRQQAHKLGINGHAFNLADGRVEVLACGQGQQVDQLVQWLHVGPQYASVSRVELEELDPRSVKGFTTG